MDKKALLSNLVSTYDELTSILEKSISEYRELENEKVSAIPSDMTEKLLASLDEQTIKENNIVKLGERLSKVIEDTNRHIVDILPSSIPSLKMILKNRENSELIIKCNEVIDDYYSSCGGTNCFCSVVNKINDIKNMMLNIEKIIEKNENLQEFEDNVIYNIKYEPLKHKFTINNKSVLIDKGEKDDLFLRAFFLNPKFNLLTGEVCNGDIYELAEEDGISVGKSKVARQKFVDGGYRHLNDKIRQIVPNNKNLVAKVDNGLVLNPELEIHL